MGKFFRRLGLISWKSFIPRTRSWKAAFFEVIFPVVVFVLFVILNRNVSELKPVNVNEPTTRQPSDVFELSQSCSSFHLLYTPVDDFTRKIMESVVVDSMYITLKPCDDEVDMEAEVITLKNKSSTKIFGIVFEEYPIVLGTLGDFKYKIRPNGTTWETKNLYPESPKPGPMYISDEYVKKCFLKLQLALDKAFIQFSLNSQNNLTLEDLNYTFNLQPFPYPPYVKIEDLNSLYLMYLPLCTVAAFFFSLIILVRRLMEEKVSGAKELMSMMGMKKGLQWSGWFITTLFIMTVDVAIILIFLKVGFEEQPIFRSSNGFLVFLFLFLYCSSSIASMFVVCAVCPKVNLGVLAAFFVMGLSACYPIFLDEDREKSGLLKKALFSILPNTALANGLMVIGNFEGGGSGQQWKNLWEAQGGNDDEITMGLILVILLCTSIGFISYAYFISEVFPGQFGVAKPWYFPLQYLYEKLCNQDSSGENERFALNEGQANDQNEKLGFEALPPEHNAGIQLKRVRKVFQPKFSFVSGGGETKVAVDDVSLDILEGEITVLLGHNGAGKTVLISIITGICSPTEGNIVVNGYDLKKEIDKIRESLGLCPQHNMLLPDLNVWEHLMFFSMCKGLTYKDAKLATDDLLKKLALESKRKELAKNLSGGLKRQLCVGMALAGKPKIVILDEPTSGMDPELRRRLWDLLLNMRGEQTVLITTHNMEEADILGDRIAIMASGVIKCYGTSLFLKSIYGAGYHLTIIFSDLTSNKSEATARITDLITENVPGSALKDRSDDEVSYTLPSSATSYFPEAFNRLDQEKEALGIRGVSLSVTTLDEVFIKVGKLVEVAMVEDKSSSRSTLDAEQDNTYQNVFVRVSGVRLFCQLVKIFFIKKALFMKSNWLTLLFEAVAGIFLIIISIGVASPEVMKASNEPELTFSIEDYENSNAFVTGRSVDGLRAKNIYSTLLTNKHTNVKQVDWGKVSDALLSAAKIDESDYRENYVVSAAFDENEITVFYSTTLMHSCPISLNLATNTLLRLLTNSTENLIIASNHPFEINTSPTALNLAGSIFAIVWLIFGIQGLSLICLFFTMLPTLEGASGARHLQLMAIKSFSFLYWVAPFLFDLAIFMLATCTAFLAVPIATGGTWIYDADFYGSLIVLTLMIGASMIPFAYLISYFKKNVGSASTSFLLFSVSFGTVLAFVAYMSEIMFDSDGSHKFGLTLHVIGTVIPFFTGAYALAKLTMVAQHNVKCSLIAEDLKESLCQMDVQELQDVFDISCCENLCKLVGNCNERVSYLGWGKFSWKASDTKPTGVGIELVILALISLFYFGFLFLMDMRIFPYIFEKLIEFLTRIFRRNMVDTTPRGDEDVLKENDRIDFAVRNIKSDGEDILLVHKLKKNYGLYRWWKNGIAAVKGVSFGVCSGECFGLLGASGSGKTSTFEMITGSLPASSNSSYVLGEKCAGWSGVNKKYLNSIGYCPQIDATVGSLTGRQMLKLFAVLRGIPYDHADEVVQFWLNSLGLNEPADRITSAYSGGNHRRLCTAIALMADSPLVCLDEPTAGVDPVARRLLWDTLSSARSRGIALVLTSHSMEECEALCSRLAIMDKGEFLCFGMISYLKNKYAQGFTLLVKVNVQIDLTDINIPQISTLKERIETSFDPCTIKDEHEGFLHYHITNPEMKWAYMFSVMEELKEDMQPLVEDYSISDTTLEQLFLSFIKHSEITDGITGDAQDKKIIN